MLRTNTNVARMITLQDLVIKPPVASQCHATGIAISAKLGGDCVGERRNVKPAAASLPGLLGAKPYADQESFA
jgi:hypothetical protein